MSNCTVTGYFYDNIFNYTKGINLLKMPIKVMYITVCSDMETVSQPSHCHWPKKIIHLQHKFSAQGSQAFSPPQPLLQEKAKPGWPGHQNSQSMCLTQCLAQ